MRRITVTTASVRLEIVPGISTRALNGVGPYSIMHGTLDRFLARNEAIRNGTAFPSPPRGKPSEEPSPVFVAFVGRAPRCVRVWFWGGCCMVVKSAPRRFFVCVVSQESPLDDNLPALNIITAIAGKFFQQAEAV